MRPLLSANVSRIQIRMKLRAALGALVLALAAALVGAEVPERLAQTAAPVDTFRVVRSYPHDATAYTRGWISELGAPSPESCEVVSLEQVACPGQENVAVCSYTWTSPRAGGRPLCRSSCKKRVS